MATTFSTLSKTTREIVRFIDEAAAFTYIKMMAPNRSFRIADYGFEADQPEPYWVATDHLLNFYAFSREELDRWKACGRTSF